MTWAKLETGELHGSYGKRELLQTIYTVCWDWQNQARVHRIWRRLASRLPNETIDPSEHVVSLMIKIALPEVKENVVAIWVNAILYGQARHVRPFKLRSFFHVKGGLVACARLYGEEQQKKRAEKEAATQEKEDWKQEQDDARRARRRRSRWTMPDGMRSLNR